MFWIIFTILTVIAFVATILIGGFVQRLSAKDRVTAKEVPSADADEDDYLSARRKGDRERLEDLAHDKNLIAKATGELVERHQHLYAHTVLPPDVIHRFAKTLREYTEQMKRVQPIIRERVRQRVAMSEAAVLAPTTAYGPRKL